MHSSAFRFTRRILIGATLVTSVVSCGGDGGTPPPQPPGSPTNSRVTAAGDQQVTVAWDASANATGYNLYIASQAGVTKANYASKPDGQRRTGVTSPVAVTGLVNGRTYYFVVTATSAAGESGESASVGNATASGAVGSRTPAWCPQATRHSPSPGCRRQRDGLQPVHRLTGGGTKGQLRFKTRRPAPHRRDRPRWCRA